MLVNDQEKLEKISNFVPCKEGEDRKSNLRTVQNPYARVPPLYWPEVKLLTCILDHCDYPYCQVAMRFDDWQQRRKYTPCL